MKIKLYSVLIIILIVFSHCSNDDDDDIELLDPEVVFVHKDGSKVLNGDCITEGAQYRIEITIKSKNNGGHFKNKKVDFSVNGILNSLVFTELGTQSVPISLINGVNFVQLIESGIKTSVDVKLNCNSTIFVDAINFVFADGSEITEGDCLDLNVEYAIKIKTRVEGTGIVEPTKMEFTINAVDYSATFTEAGTKIISVSLRSGDNVAQLSDSDISTSISLVESCNATILADAINFVYGDGSEIASGDCLDLSKDYAVKIRTKVEEGTEPIATKIGFTINGVYYTTTFTEAGAQIISVSLKVGDNTAQLSDSGILTSISLVESCNATILADAINFVYGDGSEIASGDCLDLNAEYAIKIKTRVEGTGQLESTKIEYTINGVLYSMEFSDAGSKINSVSIKEGQNIAQVIGEDLEGEINFIAQGDFQFVE